MLDTDQLRSFLAIVDTGSFTRAAERVNKTQSAVSMQIRRLEEQLGRALFVKNGRGVKISHDGETLVDYARQILRLEASAVSAVSDRGLNGRVLLGMPDDYAEWLLPEILKQFSLTYPAVELSIICDSSVALLDRVARREVDLAVITSNVTSADRVEPLAEEPLTFVGSRRAAPFDQRPLPLALDGPSCCWRSAALEALDAAEIDHRLVVVSRSRAAIIPVVDAGLALTVLPRAALGPDSRAFGPEEGLPALPSSKIGMLHSTAARSREVEALADVIRQVGTRMRNGAGNVVPLSPPAATEKDEAALRLRARA